MPVTKTAKRALRSSKRKESLNKIRMSKLEISIKSAKKPRLRKTLKRLFPLVDRASKEKTIHKNKASRIKSQLSKLYSLSKVSK